MRITTEMLKSVVEFIYPALGNKHSVVEITTWIMAYFIEVGGILL